MIIKRTSSKTTSEKLLNLQFQFFWKINVIFEIKDALKIDFGICISIFDSKKFNLDSDSDADSIDADSESRIKKNCIQNPGLKNVLLQVRLKPRSKSFNETWYNLLY